MTAQLILMAAMAVAAVLGAGGQICLKLATDNLVLSIKGLLTNWYLWGFAVLYGIGVIINIVTYRLGGKVSVLYPVISLSYVAAAIFAWWLLGETISGWTLAGILCIMLGVSLIGVGAA